MMAYCSICDKTFKTIQSLASHRYVYHKAGTESETKNVESVIESTQSDGGSTRSDSESCSDMEYESPKRNRLSKQINRSTQSDIKSGTQLKYKSLKRLTNKININTAASSPRLVKHLCKWIIEGDLPLTKKHIKILKPDAKVIREIAHGRVAEGQKLIHRQVLLHDETGDSALGKLLETAINILQMIFYS